MSREKRFRALVERPGTDTRYFHYFKAGESVPANLSVVAWCEFTMQRDYTGREIWEGDICKASYVCHACKESEPHILTGEIIRDSYGTWMFDFGHGAMPISCLIEDHENEIEVIGNIYENSELLDERTEEKEIVICQYCGSYLNSNHTCTNPICPGNLPIPRPNLVPTESATEISATMIGCIHADIIQGES